MRAICYPKHTNCGHRPYIGKAVTLNGEPATIARTPDGFASVRQLAEPHLSVEWSWCAVFNICDNKAGRFTA